MRSMRVIVLLLCALPVLHGCSARTAFGSCAFRTKTGECYQRSSAVVKETDLQTAVYAAADALLQRAEQPLLAHQSIFNAGIAPIDALEYTSALGRLIAEQLADRFNQQGYTVVVRNAAWHSLANKNPLELRRLGETQSTVIASGGTYAVADDKVYINLKLFRFSDGLVLSTYSFDLPLGNNLLTLLERIEQGESGSGIH